MLDWLKSTAGMMHAYSRHRPRPDYELRFSPACGDDSSEPDGDDWCQRCMDIYEREQC